VSWLFLGFVDVLNTAELTPCHDMIASGYVGELFGTLTGHHV
jgi:hypothetical protein